MATDTTEWLTVSEACQYLRVTRATLYRWARAGRVRLVHIGRRSTRLRRDEIEGLLAHESRPPRVTIVDPARFAVYDIADGLTTVGDAVRKFGVEPDGSVVFRNQVPWQDMATRLEAGDLLVILPPGAVSVASESREHLDEAWLRLAQSSFARDWDNEKDAIYDDWKELYGVRDR